MCEPLTEAQVFCILVKENKLQSVFYLHRVEMEQYQSVRCSKLKLTVLSAMPERTADANSNFPSVIGKGVRQSNMGKALHLLIEQHMVEINELFHQFRRPGVWMSIWRAGELFFQKATDEVAPFWEHIKQVQNSTTFKQFDDKWEVKCSRNVIYGWRRSNALDVVSRCICT